MAVLIDDSGTHGYDAEFIGVEDTAWSRNETDKSIWFSSAGTCKSGFILPDSPWILYEVYANDLQANDLTGGTNVYAWIEWTSTIGTIATTLSAWYTTWDSEATTRGYSTYSVKATHYTTAGGDVADVYDADESGTFGTATTTAGSLVLGSTEWIMSDDLFADNVNVVFPELVEDGTFDVGISQVTVEGATTIAWQNSDSLRTTSTSSTDRNSFIFLEEVVVGREYTVKAERTAYGNSNCSLRATYGNGVLGSHKEGNDIVFFANNLDTEIPSYTFISTGKYLAFKQRPATSNTMDSDNYSCKYTGNSVPVAYINFYETTPTSTADSAITYNIVDDTTDTTTVYDLVFSDNTASNATIQLTDTNWAEGTGHTNGSDTLTCDDYESENNFEVTGSDATLELVLPTGTWKVRIDGYSSSTSAGNGTFNLNSETFSLHSAIDSTYERHNVEFLDISAGTYTLTASLTTVAAVMSSMKIFKTA